MSDTLVNEEFNEEIEPPIDPVEEAELDDIGLDEEAYPHVEDEIIPDTEGWPLL